MQTRIYKRRWKEFEQRTAEGSADTGRLVKVDNEGDSKTESSRYFKKKLSEYYLRNEKVHRLIIFLHIFGQEIP